MKNLMLILTTAFALCLPLSVHAQTVPALQNTAVTDTSGIVAYSDTTVTDTATADNEGGEDARGAGAMTINDVSDPFNLIAYLTTLDFGGVIVAIFFVLLCIITVLSPVILIAVILYLVFKRRNDRYRVIEKAMETGQPLPDDMKRGAIESNEVLWRKGVKNFFIGLGLIAVFVSFGIESLIGVGVLVALYGAGQGVIAKTSAGKKDKEDEGEGL